MSFDLTLIRRFETVHRRGSFSRAADELGMTHSAMTKSIRTLEQLWNVRLFERTTRSVVTTAAGRRLAELAPELLAHAAQGKAQVVAAGRSLAVVCGPAIIDGFVPEALVALHRTHPGVAVEVEGLPPELAIERLLQRRAHLLLYHRDSIAAFGARRDLEVRIVVEEPYHLLCANGHPAAAESDIDVLLGYDFAIAGFDPGFAANLDPVRREAIRRTGFPRFRLSSQHACVELARSGAAVTLLPRTPALRACSLGGLVSREVPGIGGFALAAVTLAEASDPLVAALVAAVAATAPDAGLDGSPAPG